MEQRIRSKLHTTWAGQRIVYLPTVDSTNRVAKQLAAQGAEHGTLVLADTQTAGRGRRGRGWISPAGEGIFLTMMVKPQTAQSEAAKLSLLTAVATARAIERETGLCARIKWPNDIVCEGRKVCGMLLEMTADDKGEPCVVVGVGMNVHQTEFEAEIIHTASSMDLLSGKRQSRSALIAAFLTEFEALWSEKDDTLMEAYRALSATLGQKVRVVGMNETFVGTACGVDESGALMVQDESGALRTVLAGDVSVRGLMGYV